MRNLLFLNCTKIHDELFFLTTFMGRGFLAKMNADSGKVSYCNIMEGFDSKKTSAVMDFFENFQSKIYALDSYGNNLAVFDLKRGQCQYIPLKCDYQKQDNFVAFERYGADYYIFPRCGGKIMLLRTEENEITEMPGCFGDGKKVQCVCRAGNDMWILPEDTDQIYCYDISGKKEKVYKLGRTLHDCVHSVLSGRYIYILNVYGIIYRWDIEKTELHEIMALETIHDKKESMSRIIYAGNRLIILPEYGNHIKLFDVLTGKAKVYSEYPEDFEYQTTWIKYFGYCEDERYYYFAAPSANYLLKIEKQSGRLAWVKVDKDSLVGKALELFHEVGVDLYYEGSFEIMDLLRANAFGSRQANKGNIGRKIYDVLR